MSNEEISPDSCVGNATKPLLLHFRSLFFPQCKGENLHFTNAPLYFI